MPLSWRHAFCLLVACVISFSHVVSIQAFTIPTTPNGFVNDFAEVLTEEQIARLSEQLRVYEEQTSNEMAIVTVPTMDGDIIEPYATRLFETWGIGKEETNNGVLLLLAIEDRKLRIEVGYGLEDTLTDAASARIIANAKPFLKEERFPQAVDQMTEQILATLTTGKMVPAAPTFDDGTATLSDEEQQFIVRFLGMLFGLLFLSFFLFFRILPKFGKRSSGSDSSSSWGSSSSSSSSSSRSSGSSFGGGRSGGGGASGSW